MFDGAIDPSAPDPHPHTPPHPSPPHTISHSPLSPRNASTIHFPLCGSVWRGEGGENHLIFHLLYNAVFTIKQHTLKLAELQKVCKNGFPCWKNLQNQMISNNQESGIGGKTTTFVSVNHGYADNIIHRYLTFYMRVEVKYFRVNAYNRQYLVIKFSMKVSVEGSVCVDMQRTILEAGSSPLRRFPFRHCWLLKVTSNIQNT